MSFPSWNTNTSTSSTSSSSSSSSYLTPLEVANHRRSAVTPLPSSPSSAGENNLSADNSNDSPSPANDLPTTFLRTFGGLPNIVWNVHPDVTLKLRKLFYPLGVTRLTIGADYNLRTHRTSLNWSWKDRLIGGRLNMTSDELSITKSFDLDKQTKLDVRAALDFHSRRTLLSVRFVPFGRVVSASTSDGALAIRQTVSLDKRLSAQFCGRLHLPVARFSTGSTGPVSLGDGDFVVDVDEVNVRFLLQ